MPDLKRYHEKRDPERTPEPFGEEPAGRAVPGGVPRAFVVQQHDARRMHWDLRLEIGGVLVSWAIPRGPTLDPRERRLAVQTEDHPMEYSVFEGIIPSGNYGAGAMIVWDRGSYHTVDGVAPSEGLERGKLDLVMEGHKLRGRFALIRTRSDDGRQWLLLRKGDPPEDGTELIDAEPESVLSGLTVAELRENVSRTDAVRARLGELGVTAGTAPDPRGLRPMLAGTAEAPFSGKDWIFEVKYDGVRVLASKLADGSVELRSRTGRDVTRTYGEVALAVAHLPLDDFVLDGEIVTRDESGRSSFGRLQKRFTLSDATRLARAEIEIPVLLYAFDLLSASGCDLGGRALYERKQVLAEFVPPKGVVRFADHVEGDGEALFEAAREHGLEGVIAKKTDSRYEAGRRSKNWLKIKVPRSADLAIVGYVGGRGSRKALGSLMLAWRKEGELVYAGSAGSGLAEETIEHLLTVLNAARVDAPQFVGAPDPGSRGAVYVAPELVCEVGYTEVTTGGLLRHPVFVRLREDRTPDQCESPADRNAAAEAAPVVERPEARLQLSRLDKVFWPIEGYTKGDLLAFYGAAWPWLEPYLRDRPVVLTRYPDGIDGKYFYQKNAPDFTPDWVERETIDGTDYFVCNEKRTLLYVINSGAIPLHVWSARLTSIDRPDWLILDLDPKEAPFRDVVRIARHIHGMLRDLEAPHYVKTSGQDGLHVLLPLRGQLDHKDARAVAEVMARVVCADLPEIATIARPIAARGDKVYVDYGQNGYGRLIASPLSVRPRPGAPVSTPLPWTQVTSRLSPGRFTIKTALRQLEKRGDPMRAVLDEDLDIERLLGALQDRLARSVAS